MPKMLPPIFYLNSEPVYISFLQITVDPLIWHSFDDFVFNVCLISGWTSFGLDVAQRVPTAKSSAIKPAFARKWGSNWHRAEGKCKKKWWIKKCEMFQSGKAIIFGVCVNGVTLVDMIFLNVERHIFIFPTTTSRIASSAEELWGSDISCSCVFYCFFE